MRGVYSFTLVFVFTAILVLLLGASTETGKTLNEGSQRAMEIERASFVRFQLEENTDSIIEKTILKEIKAGNHNGESLNEKISTNLLNYFNQMELSPNQGTKIEFFEVNSSALSKQFTPITNPSKKLSGLKKYCKTIAVNLKERVFLVEFYFTGGLMKNRAVLAKIRVGKAKQYYLLLPGYSVKKMVVV